MKKNMTINHEEKVYKLIKDIGSGGSGVVWKVQSDDKFYAIKFLQESDDKDKKIRFKNECDFCSSIEHERIIKFLGYGNHNDTPFAIMTYYENTLRKAMKDNILSFEEKIKVCLQLCEALSFIHSLNHYHRDIKPENILLDKKNNIILTDFGISHFKDVNITKKGDRLANYDYHAPEQMKSSNEKFVGTHTDIYSLGLIINELFTQNIPYGQKYVKIGDVYPVYAEVDNLVENMISQKIEDRINDAKLVHSELEIICTSINDTSANLIEELSTQIEDVKLHKNKINQILEMAANDILMAKRIFYYEVEKLKLFNPNYNMRIGYNVSKFLLNLSIQEQLYKLCKEKFEYECNVYKKGKSNYKSIDLAEDKELYDNLLRILGEYPVNNDLDLSGKILKYYSSCADYHCEELLKRVNTIIDECKTNLLNAPILWIINHLKMYLKNSYEIFVYENYEIEYEILINWEHTKHFFDDDNKIDLKDGYIIKKEEERERTICEFKKKYNASVYNQKNDSRLIVFHNYAEYSIFKSESLEKAKPHYIFEGDVLDLLRLKRQSKNAIELEFNSFDLDSTLPKLLGIIEIE